jgi:DNA-binding NarL/FixJ family response regulator
LFGVSGSIKQKGMRTMAEKIEVLVIDDESEWLKQIAVLLNLEPDILVVGTAKTAQTGCQLAQVLNPHIVLLDLYLDGPEPDGLRVLEELQTACGAKIIVTTMEENPEFIKKALLSGAKEYIVKENYKMLPEIIRASYRRPTPAELMAVMAEEYRIEKKRDQLLDRFSLTSKEKQVFICMEKNLTNRETAREIGVELKTIKNYITAINKKLNTGGHTKNAIEKIKKLLYVQE